MTREPLVATVRLDVHPSGLSKRSWPRPCFGSSGIARPAVSHGIYLGRIVLVLVLGPLSRRPPRSFLLDRLRGWDLLKRLSLSSSLLELASLIRFLVSLLLFRRHLRPIAMLVPLTYLLALPTLALSAPLSSAPLSISSALSAFTPPPPASAAWSSGATTAFAAHSSCNATQRRLIADGLGEALELAQHARAHLRRWGADGMCVPPLSPCLGRSA